MYSRFSDLALRWARVSREPEPPAGAPGSIKTFRAGRNYYYVRLLRWGAGQIGAVIGLLFSLGLTTGMEREIDRVMAVRLAPKTTASPSPSPPPTSEPPGKTAQESAASVATVGPAPSPAAAPSSRRGRNRPGTTEVLARMASRMPQWLVHLTANWLIPFFVFLEYLAVATFAVQFPFTYALVRIEFDQHWYMVTDRSLRIRTGVLSLSESTMSFANLQQVEVKQGPLQRLLSLADVRVQSAGGGHSSGDHESEALHVGVFRSVDNAEDIRDLMLARLRAFREAGLGDPHRTVERTSPAVNGMPLETLIAAREVLRQARALRETASTHST